MPKQGANEPMPAPISPNFEADSYKSSSLLERWPKAAQKTRPPIPDPLQGSNVSLNFEFLVEGKSDTDTTAILGWVMIR